MQRGTLRLRFISHRVAWRELSPLRKDPFSSTVIGVGTSPINFNPMQEEMLFQILDSGIIRPQALCVREGPSLEKQIWIHSAACMASSVLPVGAAKGCNAKWQKSLLIRVKIFGNLVLLMLVGMYHVNIFPWKPVASQVFTLKKIRCTKISALWRRPATTHQETILKQVLVPHWEWFMLM